MEILSLDFCFFDCSSVLLLLVSCHFFLCVNLSYFGIFFFVSSRLINSENSRDSVPYVCYFYCLISSEFGKHCCTEERAVVVCVGFFYAVE